MLFDNVLVSLLYYLVATTWLLFELLLFNYTNTGSTLLIFFVVQFKVRVS